MESRKIVLSQKPTSGQNVIIFQINNFKTEQISNFASSEQESLHLDPSTVNQNTFVVEDYFGQFLFRSTSTGKYLCGPSNSVFGSLYLRPERNMFTLQRVSQGKFVIKNENGALIRSNPLRLDKYDKNFNQQYFWTFQQVNNAISEGQSCYKSIDPYQYIVRPQTHQVIDNNTNFNPPIAPNKLLSNIPLFQSQQHQQKVKGSSQYQQEEIEQNNDLPYHNKEVKILNSSFTRLQIQGQLYLDTPIGLSSTTTIANTFILESSIGFLKMKYAFKHKASGYYLGGTSSQGGRPSFKPHCLDCQYYVVETRAQNVYSIKNKQNFYLGIDNRLLIFKRFDENAKDLMWRIESVRNKSNKFPANGEEVRIINDVMVKQQIEGNPLPDFPLVTTIYRNIATTFVIQEGPQGKFGFRLKQTGDYLGGGTGVGNKIALKCKKHDNQIYTLEDRGGGFYCIRNRQKKCLGIDNGFVIVKEFDGNCMDILWKFEKAYLKDNKYEEQKSKSYKFSRHDHQ